jgi:hypothetical protein
MATITAADKLGEGPLELYAHALANLIRIDLPIDTGTIDREPRLLASYFHGNVEVLCADDIDELGQKSGTTPYAAVILVGTGHTRHDGTNIPTVIELRVVMRLPAHREGDATGVPQERVTGAFFERVYGDRYGLGLTTLPHPDDMAAVHSGDRRCIADGIVAGLSSTGAVAARGEDRLRTEYKIEYRTRLAFDDAGRFRIVGGGNPP